MSNIISIVNQKGGVGKTTTAINVASTLAITGSKVLLIDLDPQGNASTGLGYGQKERDNNLFQLLTSEIDAAKCIKKTSVPNLDIIVSSMDLSLIDTNYSDSPVRHLLLFNQMFHVEHLYDYILIDCPPSLGLLTINALKACRSVIIPIQCEFFSLEGLSHLVKTIKMAKKSLNPNIFIEGILLTMVDKRNKLSHSVERDVRENFKNLVFETVIPRNVKISEAPACGEPVILYDQRASGSFAYLMLAKELHNKYKGKYEQAS